MVFGFRKSKKPEPEPESADEVDIPIEAAPDPDPEPPPPARAKSSATSDEVDAESNYIAADTEIEGDIITSASLVVAGEIKGQVQAGGSIKILDGAVIRGDVSGSAVRVSGTVHGTVTVAGKLIIEKSGAINGDIAVHALLIEDGGSLVGQCRMGSAEPAKKLRAVGGSAESGLDLPALNFDDV